MVMTGPVTIEALVEARNAARKQLLEAYEQLCNIDADGDLPVKARDKNPPDTLRAVAERAVRMLEEIRAEDAAKGRPWWAHTLAKFALDDLVYALAELPDPEASLATATSELARLRERLEIAHAYDGTGNKIPFPEGMEHLDGIECRDETIRNLEEQISQIRAEGEAKDRALKPFADAARWLFSSTAPDGIDDGLTVVAEVASRPERTADLSTSHFADARTALARATANTGERDDLA